jgi:hypothetical protein
LLRNYYFNQDGRDTTGWFAAQAEILYFSNRYRHRISLLGTVQLLEKCTLVSLRYDELDELYELDQALPTRSDGASLSTSCSTL